MKTQDSSDKGLIGMGIFSAIGASLCCITPVLALIAGSSGIAATFSWLEPARPYLIGLTVLILGFAWYQKLKPKTKKEIECACEEDEKKSFLHTKSFLGIVTVFAFLVSAFPYYSHIFYPNTKAEIIVVESGNVQQVNLDIEGMTCAGCEEYVKKSVAQLNGYIEATANYETGKAEIRFDKSEITVEKIVEAVNKTGYKVANYSMEKTN